MVNTKRTKKAVADAVYAKKGHTKIANPFTTSIAGISKNLNPFEVHINKEKFHILGRTCKHDKGLPGVSRAKAVKRRKETLGVEFREKHKTNKFLDKRIGRNFNGTKPSEDVMTARFVAEKMAQMRQSKASRFNLNGDEVLTHRGQTLEEIEQFHDERSDDEELEDDALNANFTEAANFGGEAAQGKDRKTVIEEMIIEQKKRKLEILKEKDELQNLTDKLDSNYKDLIGLVGKMSKDEMKAKQAPDDYDKIMREMVFEPRGAVSDKLLSEEDLAKKEKERLEKLENERLKRMQSEGEATANDQPKHRSADDLDDGYFANEEHEEEGPLAYNIDGKLDIQRAENVTSESDHEEDGSTTAESDDKEECESSDDEGDNLSDLKQSDSEPEENEDQKQRETVMKKQESNKSENLNKKEKNINSKIDLDLPFTLEMPTSYDQFIILIRKHTPVEQAIILERLIKNNHPKLLGVNREDIVKLFAYLMQYINELFSDISQHDIALHFKILDRLNPQLYDLVHLNPEKMSVMLLDVINEKYGEFRKNSKDFPKLQTVIFFKLVSNYFTTSDFRHPVVTPCYIFMQHILSKATVRSRQDIALGLFLVTVILEFSHDSKRFLPAAFNFLLGIVFLSIPKRPIEVLKVVPPFQTTGPMSSLLVIEGNGDTKNYEAVNEELLKSEDLVMTNFSTEFKIRALNTTFKLIKAAITIVKESEGSNFLAEPLWEIMNRTSLDSYPEFVRQNYNASMDVLKDVVGKTLTKIVPPEKKPKALRLFEPRIETVYDDKRRPKLTKEKEEKVKLMHKLKRETKGAVREIRRDTEFLQKIRIQQQIQSDLERKEKVKRIYQEASIQQGELNELARAKKKKKF